MRRFVALFLAGLLLAVLAGPAAAADPARPFKGGGTGADSMSDPTGCPANSAWRYTSVGSGTFTHLGNATFVVTHCSWFTGPTSGGFGPGTITFTAANGDRLVVQDWGTFELTMGPDGPVTSDVTLYWEVMPGGTGRFAHASGQGGAHPFSVLASGMTSATFWGELSY